MDAAYKLAIWALIFGQCGVMLASGEPAPRSREVIERILAVVDGRPVTLSDVRVFAAVRGSSVENALEPFIDERLMLREASRFPQTEPSREEEEQTYQTWRARIPSTDISEQELRRAAHRQLAIVKYIEMRFRPRVRIEDATLREAYVERYGSAPDRPSFESAEAELRRSLSDKALDQAIEEWIKELRAETAIRYVSGRSDVTATDRRP